MVEPLAIGAHGIRRANIREDEFVLVMGAVGLGTIEFARLAGADIIVLDIDEKRLQFCKDILKLKYVINASTEDVHSRLKEITKGDMPIVVIDATGNQNVINNALQYLAHGGRFILIGLQKDEISFKHPEFHKREATLLSSRNATREDFEHVINSIKKGLVDPKKYITQRVRFDGLKNVFETWPDVRNHVIKTIVELDD